MKHADLTIRLTPREALLGWAYLGFELVLLPVILVQGNALLGFPLPEADLNFVYFAINYLAIFLIFRRVLAISSERIWKRSGNFFLTAALGFGFWFLCNLAFGWLIPLLDPGFVNANDQSIAQMARGNFSLLILGTVFLVPMVEECLYRGLVFGSLYSRSRPAAYAVSAAVFSLIHVVGYLGSLSPLAAVLSFLQYLPAGLCLAWSYARTGTIFAPILIHALVNAYGIYSMR